MYKLNPDLEWYQYSRGHGIWSIKYEEWFNRQLANLARFAKLKGTVPYKHNGNFNFTYAKNKLVKSK